MVVFEPEQRAYSRAADEGEHTLPLKGIMRIIWSHVWVIVLVVSIITGIAAGSSFAQTPTYESSVKLLVGQREGAGTSANLGNQVEGLQQLTKTLTEAVSSHPVAEAAIEQLNLGIALEGVLEHLKVEQIPETQYIKADYRDSSPERAHRWSTPSGTCSPSGSPR